MEFSRASQVANGVLFHSSMTTSWRWWMLDTLRSSTFHLRMPHGYSIRFRSGDMLGQSITFTLSFFSKAAVVIMLEYYPAAQSLKEGDHVVRPLRTDPNNNQILHAKGKLKGSPLGHVQGVVKVTNPNDASLSGGHPAYLPKRPIKTMIDLRRK